MQAQLSKKINIPNSDKLSNLNWNKSEGWIAAGSVNGLLKVIKIDQDKNQKTPLNANQTLKSHECTITVICWNEIQKKLTTADSNGLIVVWCLHKQLWFEEMINNRNKSIVSDMKWSNDGQKICICYEDGAVIVGSVEGERLWQKELAITISLMEWNPDGKQLSFVTKDCKIKIQDSLGNFVTEIKIGQDQKENMAIASFEWLFLESSSKGSLLTKLQNPHESKRHCILAAFKTGEIMLMSDENDKEPVIFNSNVRIESAKWNYNGDIIAVCGPKQPVTKDSEQLIEFQSNSGEILKILQLNQSVSAISFDTNSLRLGFSSDQSIFFCNLKQEQIYTYFSNTLVLAARKSNTNEFQVTFWNTTTDQKYSKSIKYLINIDSYLDQCILISIQDEDLQLIQVCNSIGSPVQEKAVNFKPEQVSMNRNHIILATKNEVQTWGYRPSKSSQVDNQVGKELIFSANETSAFNTQYDKNKQVPVQPSEDPIMAIASFENGFLVCKAKGSVLKQTLPNITLDVKQSIRDKPMKVNLNSTASQMSVIDINGEFKLQDFEAQPPNSGVLAQNEALEKKDVHQVRWASDNPNMLCILEKNKLVFIKNGVEEEPVVFVGYLLELSDLKVKSAFLDEIATNPLQNLSDASHKNFIKSYECELYRKSRELIMANNNLDAYTYVEQNDFECLQDILLEKCLLEQDQDTANRIFFKRQNYRGIKFLKSIEKLEQKKQQAEILYQLEKFDEAEKLQKEMDRKDLALKMRLKMGDWEKVSDLCQQGLGDDELHFLADKKIGDTFQDQQKQEKAIDYYISSNSYEELVETQTKLNDLNGLSQMLDILPENSNTLVTIGERLENQGLCDQAVAAQLKASQVKRAVDCCILLNQWDKAVELAEKHNFFQIGNLLNRQANHLLEANKKIEAIELFRRANRNTESAKILCQIAQDMSGENVDWKIVKKIQVLSAFEVESFKRRAMEQTVDGNGDINTQITKTLDTLITTDMSTLSDKRLDNPWRGAEAFHFLLLVQEQLNKGEWDSAMKTSMRLTEYESELGLKRVYSLVALASQYNQCQTECSKAFVKLEHAQDDVVSRDEKENFRKLALKLFIKHASTDSNLAQVKCQKCNGQLPDQATSCTIRSCGVVQPACIISGRSLFSKEYTQCKVCRHKMTNSKVTSVLHCPLCHSRLKRK